MSFIELCKEKLAKRKKDNEDEYMRHAGRVSILLQAVSCVEEIGLHAIAGGRYWHLVICTPSVDWRARIEQGVFNGMWMETTNGGQYRVKLSNSPNPGYEFDSFITDDQDALNKWVRNKLADYAIAAGIV